MLRSESNAELLNAPDHSTPSKVEEFTIPELGGGFVVCNLYGDFVLSVGPVDVGFLGVTWRDSEEALDYLCERANAMSEKCIVTDLKIGGSAMLLYFLNEALDTPTNRRRLASALVKEIASFPQTNILCIPGKGCSMTDLVNVYKANEMLKASSKIPSNVSFLEEPNSDEVKEEKTDKSTRSRSSSFSSFSKAAAAFDYPVPADMITPEAQQENLIVKAAAQSVFGALSTLTKAKHWSIPKIVLMGLTSLAKELYWMLTHDGYDVFVADPDPDAAVGSKIDDKSMLSWKESLTTKCDVVVLCSTECPVLTESVVDTLNCRAIMSASDFLLPRDVKARERTGIAAERKEIFEFADGLLDLGSLVMAYSMSNQKHVCTKKDMIELGAKVMHKQLHLDDIVQQYDTEDKRKFYSMVLADEVEDIGGLKLGLGTIIHNSSDSMTQWMWSKSRSMCPAFRALSTASQGGKKKKHVYYIDLGAGNGAAARWICNQDSHLHVKCINISPQQNAENRHLSDEQGLGGQVSIETSSFERLPSEYSCLFDGCISQDAFIHAYNKIHALSEAFRVTKGGGWLMVSDLMCGEADVSAEELRGFVEKNKVQNWVTPTQYVALAEEAGWSQVHFINCTSQIKVSLQDLLSKIKSIISAGSYKGLNLKLLQTHRLSLGSRIGQIDRGIFKWGIIAARKPYDVLFMTTAPVTPEPHPMMSYSTKNVDGSLKFGTDVVVLNIKDHMPRNKIMELPSTTRLIVTMSAGLDHIDMAAAEERGVRVRRAARFQIVKSVADYLLSNIIFGLRNGYQNVGVPFPGKSWDLSWNSEGVDLDRAKIGFIGMGAIAMETCRRIRALSTDCELVYNIPDGIRSSFEEGTHRMSHVGIADLYSTCDVVIPMVPLTPLTSEFVNYAAFTMMKRTCIFINMARGKVVDTEGMLRALKEKLIRHAILDTTEPEPLPEGHDLWSQHNCTILPHFATNTTYVRKELVEDIPNEIEDTLDERGILRLEEQRMRKELSEAYRITRDFGMDELVWNHISVLLSDGSYLITPGNRMFDDIGPQDLVKSSGNVTADIIHDAVYKTRDDVTAIVHLHTPATVAVSCLEMGFVPLAQEAAPFVGRVARYKWHGVSNDWEEQALLAEAIKNKKINTLIMENHGFCCFGKTLGEAWVLAYYFDKACQTQLNCLQTGAKINFPDEKVLAHAAEQAVLPDFLPGNCEWAALRKMLTRKARR